MLGCINMTACVLYLYALAHGFVTPACYVDKNTMIEPEAIHDIIHAPKEFLSTVKEAPKVYIKYWKSKRYVTGTLNWDPNYYIQVKDKKINIIHAPWKTPKVRKVRKHYKRYKDLLYIQGGAVAVSNWKKLRLSSKKSISN